MIKTKAEGRYGETKWRPPISGCEKSIFLHYVHINEYHETFKHVCMLPPPDYHCVHTHPPSACMRACVHA